MRRRSRDRALGIKNVSTAFLQSDSYPDGTIKYICFRDPITRVWNYYRQSGPIYGEVSAPKRWEDTIAPWFESMGFKRGENERSCFYHEGRDLLILLYVDDCLAEAGDDFKWTFFELEERVKCKSEDIVTDLITQNYLGMVIRSIPRACSSVVTIHFTCEASLSNRGGPSMVRLINVYVCSQ